MKPQPTSRSAFVSLGIWFRNLNIRNKIRGGYALALGVAFGGTIIGLIVGNGNYYYQKVAQQVDINEESRHLKKLQITLLQTQIVQHRLVHLLENPALFDAQYNQLQTHAAQLKKQLPELQSEENNLEIEDFNVFVKNYTNKIDIYLEKLDKLVEQIAVLQSSNSRIAKTKKLLDDFTKDSVMFDLDSLVNDLENVIDMLDRQEDVMRETGIRAEVMRSQIILISMAFSVSIAIVLAGYISNAIAHPLTAIIKTTQQVTKDSNFDLQAPVISQDEVGVLATSFNQLIIKVKHLLAELHAEKESQLIQSEKMASLGRMLAGVAHEVNNPINFIYGNIDPAKDYIDDLFSLLETYETEIPNPPQAVTEKAEEIDLNFVKEDLPKILESMKVGAERARAIILNLKDFSRIDEAMPHPVDIHVCLESTLLILNNRIKKGIKVIRNYGTIPNIEGYMGLLYQVFMNILSNAIDALEEAQETNKSYSDRSLDKNQESNFLSTITITTEMLDRDSVLVRIADNGTGIAAKTQDKMFQTFFTTKPRGVGTGLGLAISRNIIVDKHGGTINFWSEVGKGTEFVIALPIKH
ncbi:histidine kinase [Oscillatoriales cyanobacterium USR001]|nr:histidine kinase [Oscillatoriales cyanobacterium USR001]